MKSVIRASLLACGALCSLSFTACDREPLEATSRDLGTFEAISLRGAADVRITVGEAASIKIEGSTYAVKNLQTEVNQNTLSIESHKSGWAWFGDRDELRLTITMPKLTSFESSGAGNIQVTNLNGGDQNVRIAGAHNLVAHGKLDKLSIELDGAGNVDYGDVQTQEATITVNGAGHVVVKPSGRLVATVNGVGAINYLGEPQKVESNLHGIGTIARQ